MVQRTGWAWLARTIPEDGTQPQLPQQIGVAIPSATLTQRPALYWLTRRPATRIVLTSHSAPSLRLSTMAVRAVSLLAALYPLISGIPAVLALVMLLAPLLIEHVPDRLDDRAARHVRRVEDEAARRYLRCLPDGACLLSSWTGRPFVVSLVRGTRFG
ncbi:hypothetical protein ACIHIX_24550 [Streptomyces sp. NPDC051913]|uniref:hypothetical protein n=1 Tax=Streptomyces sp. NPDC051913 TaxID=3365676 RepID=UPI0037D149C6